MFNYLSRFSISSANSEFSISMFFMRPDWLNLFKGWASVSSPQKCDVGDTR